MSRALRRFEVLLPLKFNDDLVRLFIDIPDLPEHRDFLAEYKETLKIRFQQIDIWMVTFPLDVV